MSREDQVLKILLNRLQHEGKLLSQGTVSIFSIQRNADISSFLSVFKLKGLGIDNIQQHYTVSEQNKSVVFGVNCY